MGKKNPPEEFIGKVTKYGTERAHIEVPKDERKKFKPGVHVRVTEIR